MRFNLSDTITIGELALDGCKVRVTADITATINGNEIPDLQIGRVHLDFLKGLFGTNRVATISLADLRKLTAGLTAAETALVEITNPPLAEWEEEVLRGVEQLRDHRQPATPDVDVDVDEPAEDDQLPEDPDPEPEPADEPTPAPTPQTEPAAAVQATNVFAGARTREALNLLNNLLALGYTRADIITASGISKGTLSQLLNHKVNAGPVVLHRIQHAHDTLLAGNTEDAGVDEEPTSEVTPDEPAPAPDDTPADPEPEAASADELPEHMTWADWHKHTRLTRALPKTDPLVAEITGQYAGGAELSEIASDLDITTYNVLDILRRSGHDAIADDLKTA